MGYLPPLNFVHFVAFAVSAIYGPITRAGFGWLWPQ